MANSERQVSVITKALDWAYDKALDGVGVLGSSEDLAEQYLNSNSQNRWKAANSLINWQNTKSATSGFLTGLGGFATMPIAIPADMASTIFIQLRMISAIAHIGGHPIRNDQVRTLAFTCLTGSKGMQEVLGSVGLPLVQKTAQKFIQKQIPGAALKKINQAVGYRLITKAGSTGVINLTKWVPVLRGVVGGSFNAFLNNSVGNIARDTFIGRNEENIFIQEEAVFENELMTD